MSGRPGGSKHPLLPRPQLSVGTPMRDPLQWPAGKLPPTCDHCGATLRPTLAQGSLLPPGVARSRNANPARGAIVKRIPGELL